MIDVLNRYLGEMSDAIMDQGGTLVSYLGDGIMAVFGAPLAQSDHADRALAAAREMLGVRLPRFNAWLGERGSASRCGMGVGLNSGDVMSGHVGSERRVEYAAVGDTTNLAARLEGMTAEAGVDAAALRRDPQPPERPRRAASRSASSPCAGAARRVAAWTAPAPGRP